MRFRSSYEASPMNSAVLLNKWWGAVENKVLKPSVGFGLKFLGKLT